MPDPIRCRCPVCDGLCHGYTTDGVCSLCRVDCEPKKEEKVSRKKAEPLSIAPPETGAPLTMHPGFDATYTPLTLPASEPAPPKPAKRRLTYFVVRETYEVFDSTNGGLNAALERIKDKSREGLTDTLLIVGKVLPVEVKTIAKVRRQGKP